MRSIPLLLLWCGCASIAISAAPTKKASPTQSAFSKEANDAFWAALHGGAYEEIPQVKELLQRAYLEDPFDAVTTAHLGFLHLWRVAERERADELKPSLTDDMLLSERYFKEAVEMTGDPRYLGFLAGAELANGTIHKDERVLRTGYFRMNEAVAAFPQFNLFSRGYGRSMFPHDSDRFIGGLEDMWTNIENCIGVKIDRTNPDYTPYMAQETGVGDKRVCWNGWIAPHNHEGFSLNLGDMLVKSGDVKAARRAYANAKLSKTYEKWPFKEVLDKRIAEAEQNVEIFRRPSSEQPKGGQMMFSSAMNCSACHADLP
jgi:hypothetical protein